MTSIEETLEQRGKRYGKFTDHAQVTQDLKRVVAAHLQRGRPHMAVDQWEALDMILHKIGRIVCGDPNYADSWHDIAGYAKLVEDRLNADGEETFHIELANGSTISLTPAKIVAEVGGEHSTPLDAPVAWPYKGDSDFDGTKWRVKWCVTTDEQVARFRAEPGRPIPLFPKQ